jgi:hypothetical protein
VISLDKVDKALLVKVIEAEHLVLATVKQLGQVAVVPVLLD